MAYLASSLIVLSLYSTIFNSANLITANDSWFWPDEVEFNIDERSSHRTQKILSSPLDEELTMRQGRPAAIFYPNSSLLFGMDKMKRNSSVWKRLKTINRKPAAFGSIKPTSSENSENLNSGNNNKKSYFNVTQIHPQLNEGDWSFPEDNLITRKAELKCAEYNKAIERKDVWINPFYSNLLTDPTQKTNQNKCKGLYNPLIIGGFIALPSEFAHMVAVGWLSPDNVASFLCGGSLISNNWIVTAAHCTHGPLGPPKIVRIGTSCLSDETTGEVIGVKEITRHPSYKPPAVYADLALLKLDKTVKFGADIKPACLWTEFDTTPSRAWATGWGITNIGQEQSDKLLKVRLDIVNNVDCAFKLNRSIAIPRGVVPSMLCAGDITGNWRGDTCQGDSGGPLQILHPRYKCLHQIIGVTSFGRLCALKNFPGVYTRVSHHLDWIESIVWPDDRE